MKIKDFFLKPMTFNDLLIVYVKPNEDIYHDDNFVKLKLYFYMYDRSIAKYTAKSKRCCYGKFKNKSKVLLMFKKYLQSYWFFTESVRKVNKFKNNYNIFKENFYIMASIKNKLVLKNVNDKYKNKLC